MFWDQRALTPALPNVPMTQRQSRRRWLLYPSEARTGGTKAALATVPGIIAS